MTSTEAKQKLKDRGLIELPMGSWFRWIHPEWFAKYRMKGLLTKNAKGMWVPNRDLDKLHRLDELDKEYQAFKDEQSKHERITQKTFAGIIEHGERSRASTYKNKE